MEDETVFVSRVVPRTMPTPVSSQEDSMPSTSGWVRFMVGLLPLGWGLSGSRGSWSRMIRASTPSR